MKTCARCLEEKDESAFYRNKLIKGGLLHQCKTCVANAQALYRKTSAGKASKRREQAKHADKYRAWKRDYKKTDKGRAAARRYEKPLDRRQAKDAVSNAIKAKVLSPLPCFICGGKGEAHHCSYAPEMRLAVTWLCRSHHTELHLAHDAQ